MTTKIREIITYHELLWNLTVTELKLRYRNSALGFLWTILNPLFYLLILAVVFSQIIKLRMEHYTVFLFSGLTSWMMIQQTVIIATSSIVNNQSLIRKVYIPKLVFPLSNALARYMDHAVLVLILLAFLPVFGMRLSWSLLFIPPIVLLHFVFSLGLSLLFAVAQIKVRDVQQIVSIVFQALFYATPVIYSLDLLPERLRPVFLFNPVYYFVEGLRWPVYRAAPPPWDVWLAMTGLAAAAFLAGYSIFIRKEKYFVFHLS